MVRASKKSGRKTTSPGPVVPPPAKLLPVSKLTPVHRSTAPRASRQKKITIGLSKAKHRKLLPGQTLLTTPKRPEGLTKDKNYLFSFLQTQAVAVVEAQRARVSERTIRKHFKTVCEVEFKPMCMLDEPDDAYKQRCDDRHKRFWWPSLMWAVDMLRYRRDGGAVWKPRNLLDPDLPILREGGERARPRPAFLKKPKLAEAETAMVTPVASTSTSAATWPSYVTLGKLANKEFGSLSTEEIAEMDSVVALLRDYECERARTKSPEL